MHSVVGTYTRPNSSDAQQRTALSCNATTGNCTWSAALPNGIGSWRVSAVATDRAGNARTDPASIGINVG